nr:MAG: protein m38 [Herpesviridae sp.]
MFRNRMTSDSVVHVMELNAAYAMGMQEFTRKLKEFMTGNVVIVHDTGVIVTVCDLEYEFLGINGTSLQWFQSDFSPLSGPFVVFGVAEEWREAANRPTRQVVFLISSTGDVVGYDRGVMFYVAPGFPEFWTASLIFEYDNAVFPKTVRRYVKQAQDTLEGFVEFYNKLRLQRVLLEVREFRECLGTQRVKGATMLKVNNRLSRLLISAASAIAAGFLPMLFSDRSMLQENVAKVFWETTVGSRRRCRSQMISIHGAMGRVSHVAGGRQSAIGSIERSKRARMATITSDGTQSESATPRNEGRGEDQHVVGVVRPFM